ncbi:sialic acid-binding Ig-like lectin 13 [Rana temporaria]|uniref:sialic acid-binding Ig-like lectin 13 n=1 Tax=Rana temporaria TaxID=8407 RepID=UPI001AAD9C17|nr:sialic acid-binding Ig-like lectin 13 [Rana temporaria]
MWPRIDGSLGIWLVTILFLISKETVIATKYSIQVNQDVQIPQTMCAIVPCKFMADGREKFLNSTGHWKQGIGIIVASTNISAGTKQNFHAIGDPNNGDCTLKITNIKKEDEGTYFFRFVESKDSIIKYNYIDTQVTIQVTDIREVDGFSIQVDQIVTVQKGLCVTIPCTFTADRMKSFTGSRGHWKTICQEFVASTDKSIVGTKPNFQFMGNPNNGDCTLKITDAKEQDSGKYHFRFEDGQDDNRKHSYVFKMITIQVTDLIEKPVISDPGILIEGKKVTLTCTAPRGCPNALITWQNQTNSTNLTFVPTRSHHQTSLTCQMTFPSLKSYTQNEITLYVQYPPAIVITTEMPELQNPTNTNHTTNQEVTVQEGSSLALRCSVDSNPGAQVTWMKGEKNVLSKGNGSELMLYLTDITASEADKYHCLAHNNLGAINQTTNILVQYSEPSNSNMIAWLMATIVIILLLIGLGIFVFVRYRRKRQSDHVNLEPKRAMKKMETTCKVDEGLDNVYTNMSM